MYNTLLTRIPPSARAAIASIFGRCGKRRLGTDLPGNGRMVLYRRCRCSSCTRPYHLGAPGPVIARMLGYVPLDGVLGGVPLVGDVFDVLWRANRRNVRLLLEWLEYEHRRDDGARCVTNFGGLVPLGLHRNPGRSLLFGESAIFQMCSFKATMLEWSGA